MSKFCENCGNALRDGAQFCPKCGERVKGDYSLEVDLNNVSESKPKKNPWLIAGIVSAAAVIISVTVILVLFNPMQKKPEAQENAAVSITETKDENVQNAVAEDITGEAAEDKSEENKDADQTQTAETTTAAAKKQPDKKSESNILTPTDSDFKKLESLLNSDGGIVLSYNFNNKTASKREFIYFATSAGFFPAYKTYFNENMWSDNMIDHEDYSEVEIPADAYNWILKNVYNYNGSEIRESMSDYGITYKNDKICCVLPLDEVGLFGKFKYKSFEEKDGHYTVYLDFNGFEPYTDDDSTFIWKYVVKADLKEVDSVDGTQKMRVWSIYSIEHNDN